MLPKAECYSVERLEVGLVAEFERDITEGDILSFASNSGDYNPLHVDPEYARTSNYESRLVHGAFQVGLASAMLGMRLPGRSVLLGSVNARFLEPLFFPCRVRVRGEVTAWNPEALAGQLKVTVLEAARQVVTAEILMGFTLHGVRTSSSPECPPAVLRDDVRAAKVVLVTGASGGIGADIVSDLLRDYKVLAAVNRQALPAALRGHPNAREVAIDFTTGGWEKKIEALVPAGSLFGVVHAAWPGAPHGGLLQTPDEITQHQLAFGSSHTIALARLLFSLCGHEGGRFVALGSIVGTQKPVITLAPYVLGKAVLESTVKLLAPELARRSITINAVCPSFVPSGIHKHTNAHQRKLETARIPLGRLCSGQDVASLVRYLLSPEASFISGQVVGLSGGQL